MIQNFGTLQLEEMMFDNFKNHYQIDSWGASLEGSDVRVEDPDLQKLLEMFGGRSFNEGVYRIFHPKDVSEWKEIIHKLVPSLEKNYTFFASCWNGAILALDSNRNVDGKPTVTIFMVSTGEIFPTEWDLVSLHDDIMCNNEDVFFSDFYREWRESGGAAPKYEECIGYKVPLSLNGEDEVSNLDVWRMKVYWNMTSEVSQLIYNE